MVKFGTFTVQRRKLHYRALWGCWCGVFRLDVNCDGIYSRITDIFMVKRLPFGDILPLAMRHLHMELLLLVVMEQRHKDLGCGRNCRRLECKVIRQPIKIETWFNGCARNFCGVRALFFIRIASDSNTKAGNIIIIWTYNDSCQNATASMQLLSRQLLLLVRYRFQRC